MVNGKYTLDLVDTTGVDEKGMELLKKLNASNFTYSGQPDGSIMGYGNLCTCDDDYLCSHRLQVIADWLKENQNG